MSSSHSLLRSSATSFSGQLPILSPSPFTARVPPGSRRKRNGVMTVRATGNVLVDKSEAEKTFRLKTTYLEKIVPLLKEEFGYTNVHQVPKIEKIVVNCGIGDAAQNAKGLEAAMEDLARIAGQRPVKTRAKNSIATFKVREGNPLGVAVTLRGDVMYSFLDRFINLGLPRSRDFIGVSPNSFDGHGNYAVGVKDQSVFPELRSEAGKPRGMDVCITTTAKTDKEALKLLALMGMPFREGVEEAPAVRKKKFKRHHFMKGGVRY
ncbi:60S ribosomal protein L5 [Turnera subulata]|uniref:Large ribosomal subunit protein uL5c n=1 Tax=Turnera subulata TaxID=218843 RepID=A0A9Q0FJ60_9ROSI|nr:60S ribosomal protein L5 [Turnera subulata]